MTAKFTNFQVINKDFTRCRCNVFYTGRNRNYSDITEEALQKFIARKGYANVPVVAHLMKDDDGKYYIGGHDSKIVIDNNGIELVNECVPFGVIPEDCNPSMDLITERSGEQRKYFSVDIILWTHRYPIMEAAYSDEIYFNQSMEVFFEDYKYYNDYVVVNDFSMSALCLLRRSMDANENIEPCFESSRVKAFSVNTDKFKQNFELMLEKLKQYESDSMSYIATTTVQNNVTNSNSKELKTKGEKSMDFAKITNALSSPKYKADDGKDVCKYRLLNVTDSTIYALDMENYKPYGFGYAIAKDEEDGKEKEYVVIDFDSKVEMSLSATEKITDENFQEINIKDEIDSAVGKFSKEQDIKFEKKLQEVSDTISAKFQKDYDELKESYEAITKANGILQSKVDSYEKREKEAEVEAHKNEINSLVDSYANKLGKYSAFLVYKANIEKQYERTCEQVEQDLILMAGKYLTSKENSMNKKFSYNPISTGVANRSNESISNKYGHLLDKYIK